MVIELPHVASVSPVANAFDGENVADGRTVGSASVVECYVAPISADKAFRDFNIEISEASLLIAAMVDASVLIPGSKVVENGITYYIKVAKISRGHRTSALDHVQALLTKEQLA